MALRFKIGLDAISSYKRLPYTPWHAIAEFVDNSTQSYANHQSELDKAYRQEGTKLAVEIEYDRGQGGLLRISDNAMGMSFRELQHALHVAKRPKDTSGRSEYGMGLKTAACWIGNCWTVKTKKLGETVEHKVTVDVEKIASGVGVLPYTQLQNQPADKHYTIIEITKHNRMFYGPKLKRIRDFLSSMYREDFRKGTLTLKWQGEELTWVEMDSQLLTSQDGSRFKKNFDFLIDEKLVHGWVGILDKGSRANAGFSILHRGRVIRGWPDSWRPTKLYGQLQGSNDLVNQRLVGEINLDDFEVSHTKDDILWLGSEEEDVEASLLNVAADYVDLAKKHRKRRDDERGPTEAETRVAVDELKKELESPEMLDLIALESVEFLPSEDVIRAALRRIAAPILETEATYQTRIAGLTVKLYLADDLSPNDPYVVDDSTKPNEVFVIINRVHPHWAQLRGSEGVVNYLRHCLYDAIAEWQVRRKAAQVDPDTIKLLKDRLLRVTFEVETHSMDFSDQELSMAATHIQV